MNISLPHTQKGSTRGSLPVTYVPTSNKLVLEGKQKLHNDVVQYSLSQYIRSYYIQNTHIFDVLTSYTLGWMEYIYEPCDETNLDEKQQLFPILSWVSTSKGMLSTDRLNINQIYAW
jgi:hypothetical protein